MKGTGLIIAALTTNSDTDENEMEVGSVNEIGSLLHDNRVFSFFSCMQSSVSCQQSQGINSEDRQ